MNNCYSTLLPHDWQGDEPLMYCECCGGEIYYGEWYDIVSGLDLTFCQSCAAERITDA